MFLGARLCTCIARAAFLVHLNVASMVSFLSLLVRRLAGSWFALVVYKLLVLVKKPFLELVIGLWVLGIGLA